MTQYSDITFMEEDRRIDVIGKCVMDAPKSSAIQPPLIAFVVEDNAKADRYVEKLLKKFPGIRIVGRFVAPGNTIGVRVAGPKP